ncbi:MAG: phosphotransferase, partial [Bacteroidales bacterium]|nr:phosphotransferase [Bacteroidales bacterium]
MGAEYLSILITGEQAAQIAQELYGLRGTIAPLPGELDFNFRIITDSGSFVLKVSRPESDIEQIEFQQELLNHVKNNSNGLESPAVIPDLRGNQLSEITDDSGHTRKVRLLSWIEGRLWSSVNPISNRLLFSLGAVAGSLTKVLQGFDHPKARRYFEWDVAQAGWTCNYLHMFSEEQQSIVTYFQKQYNSFQDKY